MSPPEPAPSPLQPPLPTPHLAPLSSASWGLPASQAKPVLATIPGCGSAVQYGCRNWDPWASGHRWQQAIGQDRRWLATPPQQNEPRGHQPSASAGSGASALSLAPRRHWVQGPGPSPQAPPGWVWPPPPCQGQRKGPLERALSRGQVPQPLGAPAGQMWMNWTSDVPRVGAVLRGPIGSQRGLCPKGEELPHPLQGDVH